MWYPKHRMKWAVVDRWDYCTAKLCCAHPPTLWPPLSPVTLDSVWNFLFVFLFTMDTLALTFQQLLQEESTNLSQQRALVSKFRTNQQKQEVCDEIRSDCWGWVGNLLWQTDLMWKLEMSLLGETISGILRSLTVLCRQRDDFVV